MRRTINLDNIAFFQITGFRHGPSSGKFYIVQDLAYPEERGIVFEKEDLIKIANHRMQFGKYSGRRLIDLPEAYLLWFRERDFPSGKLGELMQVCLEIKINGLESLIDPLRID